ncbi:MAG: 3-hydroxyacyl-ACP dehydratase FabZ [Anaerovoracaceae bacterium]|jgi:3-hydroxyacyl-[acyl-carrier-protein] dehydratase
MEAREIYQALPHRYPMLLVDDIYEVKYGEYVRGVKNVTNNEPWSTGHFPDNPVFPGVLVLESMAQIGGFMFYKEGGDSYLQAYLSKLDEVKFIKKVFPGDQLIVEAELIDQFSNFVKAKCVGKVNGKPVAKAIVTYYFDTKFDTNDK